MVSFVIVLQVLFLLCVAVATGATVEDKKPEPIAQQTAEPGGQMTSTTTTTTKPSESKDVSILKQINKVNDDGSYTYGYEASDGSFKVETRDVAGNVKGMFGFVDETGLMKRVSYSASNSSGFQQAAAAGSASPSIPLDSTAEGRGDRSTVPSLGSVQTIPPRKKKDEEGDEPGGKPTVGVKKVLVSKRPVSAAQLLLDETADGRRREGNDLRRQLPRTVDDGDSPDVYGVHGRSGMQSDPVSPVVSALMSELDPIRAYRPIASPQRSPAQSYDRPTSSPGTFRPPDTISRQAQEDEAEDLPPPPPPPQYRPIPVRFRGQPPPVAYQQQPVAYPVLPPTYQHHQSFAYGSNLAALRDELMELILAFVQARVSQLVPVASYQSPQQPPPYPMPYQQPNYYVPSYYQGPRILAGTHRSTGGIVPQQIAVQERDVYAAAEQSSPIVTQTLKDGLIRMLLSTSPRYDPEGINQRSTPRLTYRRTTQSTPVRSVQIIDADDNRPVTTESPD